MSKKSKPDPAPKVDAVKAESEIVSESELNDVMKKYDRESNTRIWEGVPHTIVTAVMILFSLYCIWSTLFNKSALEIRLTAHGIPVLSREQKARSPELHAVV